MKKLIMLAIASLIAFSPIVAQTKQEMKIAKKEAKMATKKLLKENFELLELGDLQLRLEKYFLKVNEGAGQIVGTADNCINVNVGKTIALNNAINEFSSNAGGIIRGKVTSEISDIDGQQTDNLVAGFERQLLKEMRGEVKTAITLVRKNESNKETSYDVRIYCLVDPDAVHEAKMKALKNALDEQKFELEYGSKISEWVNATE